MATLCLSVLLSDRAPRSLHLKGALYAVAVGGLSAFVIVAVGQHALTPSLSPDSHMVSEYAWEDAGALMIFGFLAWAASLAATAVLVARKPFPQVQAHLRQLLVASIGVAAVGIFLTAVFETQTSAGVLPEGVERSTGGRLHDLGSGAATLALLAATLTSLRLIGEPTVFRVAAGALLSIAVLSAAGLLAAGDPVPGIRQRLLLTIACLWQGALLSALGCTRQTRAGRREDQSARRTPAS
jgi:hypothetical protein